MLLLELETPRRGGRHAARAAQQQALAFLLLTSSRLVLNVRRQPSELLLGLVAAYFPARRASKLDVLDAIAHE